MNIDFSPITNAQIYSKDALLLNRTGKKWSWRIWGYIALAFTGIGLVIVIALIIFNIKRSNSELNERRKAMKEFADKNGFDYKSTKMGFVRPEDEINVNLELPYGSNRVSHLDTLSGKLLGYNFTYNLSFVIQKSKQGEAHYPTLILTVDLPVRLPKVFINTKFNNMPGLTPAVSNFEKAEEHYLEGDFPNYYDITIEKDQQIDMYTLLTPEVMDVLKRSNKYDIWLNGNQLVLLTFGEYARYFAGAPEAFQNAEVLMREIDKIARAIRSPAVQ